MLRKFPSVVRTLLLLVAWAMTTQQSLLASWLVWPLFCSWLSLSYAVFVHFRLLAVVVVVQVKRLPPLGQEQVPRRGRIFTNFQGIFSFWHFEMPPWHVCYWIFHHYNCKNRKPTNYIEGKSHIFNVHWNKNQDNNTMKNVLCHGDKHIIPETIIYNIV